MAGFKSEWWPVIDRNAGRLQLGIRSKAGWKELGKGGFAVCLAHHDAPGIVIKVGQSLSHKEWLRNRWKDGFMGYVEAAQGSHSRYALRIFHAEWVSDFNDGTYVAIVERCYKATTTKQREILDGLKATSERISGSRIYDRSAPKVAVKFLEHVAQWGSLDVHCKNAMFRANGHPVITDPLTYRA